VRVLRFRPGNKLYVIIKDDDANVSEQTDIVPFTVRTSSGREVKLEAVESMLAGRIEEGSDGVVPATGSGVFIGKFIPVEGEPKAKGEVQLLPNDEVDVVYMDKQNVFPGIPWERSAHCLPAGNGLPEVHVFDFQSAYLPEPIPEITSAEGGDAQPVKAAGDISVLPLDPGAEFVPTRRVIMGERRESAAEAHTATGMVMVPLPVEVIWPDVLLSELSRVRVFAQSHESRRLAGVTNENEFSIDMPGTIVLEAAPGAVSRATLPAGYDSVVLRRFKPGTEVGADEYDVFAKGIFACHIPLALGEPSTLTRQDREAILEERAAREEDGGGALAADGERLDVVMVRGANDGVVIGIPYNPDLIAYENGDLGTNMIVRRYTLHSDPFLDIMDIKYSKQVKSLFMGQTVYLRVIDPAGDVSGEKDSVSVQVTVSGNPVDLPLLETYPHSGVFKGILEMATIGEAAQSSRPGVVGADYGNEVVVTYAGGVPGEKLERSFKIDMGSDGAVRGFTRVFEDPAIAMKTQFTAAESHFKMARSHRKVGMEGAAATELAQGRKLIEEAIRDYPESEGRAQAEYLLAELSLELGDATADEEEAAVYRAEALQRFSGIVSSFPDSEYAAKAQFNKALMLEKLGQIDQACEEYVKLSYKYPGNELVAETIARLGQYFIVKSRELKVLAEAEQDELKKKRLERNLMEAYVTAAEVFGRLSERFPDHRLAAKTLLLSGQAYLNAKEFKRGRSQFYSVINGDRDDKELVAEAMYWCGDAYAKEGEAAILVGAASKSAVEAFRMWKNLTWDYPETKWAKYARGRLGDGAFMASVNEAQSENR